MKNSRSVTIVLALLAVYIVSLLPNGFFFACTALWLFGPGYLIERHLARWSRPVPWLGRATVWLGLGLALISLAYLWPTTMGIGWSTTALWLILIALMLAVLWQAWRDLRGVDLRQLPERGMILLFLAVLALTAWTRWRQMAGLVFPPWVDSIHHALMIRIVGETGQAPFSLRPYLPIDQFSYHWGYHAVAATLLNTTNVTLPNLMLWFGQLLGTLQVLAIGGCAVVLWRRPLAAVIAGAVVGFLSIMPAYYLTWGRYTMLTGLLVMLAIMIAAWEAMYTLNWRAGLLVALMLAGLNVTHFVIFCFALLWCAAIWFALATHNQQGRALLGVVAAVVAAFALTAPWMFQLTQRAVPSAKGSSPLRIVGNSYNAMPFDLLWTNNNRLLTAWAAVGAVIGLWQRSRAAVALIMWSCLVIMCANPVWFGLPYLSFFANNIVAIVTFVPIALLIGGGVSIAEQRLLGWLSRQSWKPVAILRRSWQPIMMLGLVIWATISASRFQAVINDATVFAYPPDLEALNWVAENLPADARFAINTEGWLNEISRGSDGGWWLLPLLGRPVSTPPVIFNYGEPAYIAAAQEISIWLRDAGDKPSAELADWMRREGFQYTYATKRGRQFNLDRLLTAPEFEAIYTTNEVGIFKLRS